jgi:hypothetical protein
VSLPPGHFDLPLADGSLPSAHVDLPFTGGRLHFEKVKHDFEKVRLPLANGSLPSADGSLPFADGKSISANGSLPCADGSLPSVHGSSSFTQLSSGGRGVYEKISDNRRNCRDESLAFTMLYRIAIKSEEGNDPRNHTKGHE